MPNRLVCSAALLLCLVPLATALDLTRAVVVTRPGSIPEPERTAARVLIEEVEKRTGVRLTSSTALRISKAK